MAAAKAEEVVLEAEVTNKGALALYRNLGFLRDKRLLRWGALLSCIAQRMIAALGCHIYKRLLISRYQGCSAGLLGSNTFAQAVWLQG